MRASALSELDDEAVFAEVRRLRDAGEDFRPALGELVERWRSAAGFVIRRIQRAYHALSPDDEDELFQESVGKLMDRGLEQFRQDASAKTFFLRIAKHAAIDRYRRHREQVAPDDLEGEETAASAAESVQASHARESAALARESYWKAFERLQREHPNEAAAWDLYHHQDVEDHEACARQLGISVTNSYKRVSRAQAHLRLYLLELDKENA